jgi:hypothetical protein
MAISGPFINGKPLPMASGFSKREVDDLPMNLALFRLEGCPMPTAVNNGGLWKTRFFGG